MWVWCKTECECLTSPFVSPIICPCSQGLSCRNNGCSNFEIGYLCTTCKSSNASVGVDKSCHCDKGFNGPYALKDIDVCTLCNSDCFKCSKTFNCLECIEKNTIPLNDSKCFCKGGFYGNYPLSSFDTWISCNSGCLKCDSANYCIDFSTKMQK